MSVAWALGAASTAYLISLGFNPVLRLPARSRLLAGFVVATGIALAPWMIPPEAPVARLAVAIYAGVLIMKLWDLHVGAERGVRPGLGEMLGFMANPMSLVHRRTEAPPRSRGWGEVLRLVRALFVMVGAFWILQQLFDVDWSGAPFLAEHVAKVTTFFVFTTAFFDGLGHFVRLAGGAVDDPLDRPFTSRTPAEFWRRFNRCVGEFLREDVFRLVGGRRHPIRATMIAFLVSGLLHEYIFTVATGEVQGYQTAFFLLQGCAVALTLRARPNRFLGIAGTLAFNVVSSVLFFASFEGMGAFYSGGLPPWIWTT